MQRQIKRLACCLIFAVMFCRCYSVRTNNHQEKRIVSLEFISKYSLSEARLMAVKYCLNQNIVLERTRTYFNHDIDTKTHALEIQNHVFEDRVEINADTPALFNRRWVEKRGILWWKRTFQLFSIRYEHPECLLTFCANDKGEYELWVDNGKLKFADDTFVASGAGPVLLMIYVHAFEDQHHAYPLYNVPGGYYP